MRALALVLTAILLAGCAAPTASWRPLHGQDGAQRERDWTSCHPPVRWEAVVWILVVGPYPTPWDAGQEDARAQCMERAGYERARPSQ